MNQRNEGHSKRVAVHEAGHALYAKWLRCVVNVTIKRNEVTGAEGETSVFPPIRDDENLIAFYMAGVEAVRIAGCEVVTTVEGSPYSDDVIEARNDIIEAKKISRRNSGGSDDVASWTYDAGKSKATVIIENHTEALNAIADALLERQTLSNKELDELLTPYPLEGSRR